MLSQPGLLMARRRRVSAPPVSVTFPGTPTITTGTSGATSVASFLAFPTTSIPAGSAVLVIVGTDGNPTLTQDTDGGTAQTDWTLVDSNSPSDGKMAIYWWFNSTGSAVDRKLFLTIVGDEQIAVVRYVIPRATAGATLNVQASLAAWANASSPNPPNLAPAAGTQDYLWIAACAGTSGTGVTISGYPYTDGQTTAVSQVGSNGARVAVSHRFANGSSEDPGNFSFGASAGMAGATIAVWESI